MSRFFTETTLLFFCLFCFSPFSLWSCSNSPAPKIEVPKAEINVGFVKADKIFEVPFILKNLGPGPLCIEKIDLKDPIKKIRGEREILPGQEAKLFLTLNTYELNRDFEGQTILYTNDPDLPKLTLKVKGQILSPAVLIKPRDKIFIKVFKGTPYQKGLTILNNEKEPLYIKKIRNSNNQFKTNVQTIESGEKYKLIVKLNPESPAGITKSAIFLSTNKSDPDFSSMRIPIDIVILNDVYAEPDLIYFGKIKLAEVEEFGVESRYVQKMLSQRIKVKRKPYKGADFQIYLEHDIPFIKINKTPDSGAETYHLEVTLIKEKLVPGKFERFLRIKTNDKDVPELKIPVVGEIL